MEEKLGRRVADLRAKRGWTQQQLADRIAVSRVAVSHLESGLSDPSERTVTLMAGVFGQEPWELVAGTTYPSARVDRLPVVAARFTEVEHQLDLLANDLAWLVRTGGTDQPRVLTQWTARLAALDADAHDLDERKLLADARRRLREAADGSG